MKKWDFEDFREVARSFFFAFVWTFFTIVFVFAVVFTIHVGFESWIKIFLFIFESFGLITAIFCIISSVIDGIDHLKWYYNGSDKCPKWLKGKDND